MPQHWSYHVNLKYFRVNCSGPEGGDKVADRNVGRVPHVGLGHEKVELDLRRDDADQETWHNLGLVEAGSGIGGRRQAAGIEFRVVAQHVGPVDQPGVKVDGAGIQTKRYGSVRSSRAVVAVGILSAGVLSKE